jgi:CSLREA domain-containing protein
MKTLLLHACAIFTFSVSAFAAIIGEEQFDYPDGPISGQSGGISWDRTNAQSFPASGGPSNWDNVSNAPTVVLGRLVTNNSTAKREYKGSPEGDGAFNDNTFAKAVYYRVTVTTGPVVPDFMVVSSYDFGAERIFFGKRYGAANFGIGNAVANTFDDSSIPVQPNKTYVLVARVDYQANTLRLYINPDFSAAEPATAAASLAWPNTEWSTAVRLASGFDGSAVTWDDLFVATSWSDLGTVVTTAADEDDGSLGGGTGISLREAVKYAPSGALVTFAPALSGKTITLTLGQLSTSTSGRILTVDGSSLSQRPAISGNGAYRLFFVASSQRLTLRGLTLTDGNGDGGAAFNAGSLTCTDCTLVNHTGSSGAIYNQGNLTLTGCTLTGNLAQGNGGGAIYLLGNATITRCTISGNRNEGNLGGGGIYLQSPVTLTLANSIVAGNVDTFGLAADIFNNTVSTGTVTADGASLIGQNTSVESTFPAGALAGTATAPLNPRLSPLGNYGGPILTMHPLAGSPAIDASGTDPGGTDQRGFPRFADGDGDGTPKLDLGAVEAGPRLLVESSGDEDGATLRNVLNDGAVLTTPGIRLVFDTNVFPDTITLTQGELNVPAANGLFIDASNLTGPVTVSGGNASRVFNIAPGATVAMHSLVVSGGKSSDGATDSDPGEDGGGILNSGSLHLFSCTITGNGTGNGGSSSRGGAGGGIASSGPLRLTACTLSGNTTGNGGDGGAIFSSGPLTLTACTVSGNSGTYGGGVFGDSATFQHCLIAQNFSSNGGAEDVKVFSATFVNANLLGKAAIAVTSTGPTPILSSNPRLAPLFDYGGPTQTMALLPGSPAIDAATGSTAATDQRGFPIQGVADLGAYEHGAGSEAEPFRVTTSSASGVGSLPWALANAAAHAGTDSITLNPDVDGESLTLSSELLINDSTGAVTIAGRLTSGFTLTDTGDVDHRLLHVQSGSSLYLYGVTFLNGGGSSFTGNGGAILNEGFLSLFRCTVRGGQAANGGGIESSAGSSLTLEYSTVSGNTATASGGGLRALSANVTVRQSTLSGNQSTTYGGGLAAIGGNVTLTHCTLSGNGSGTGGGFHAEQLNSPVITNCIIAGNTGFAEFGPDLFIAFGNLTFSGANIVPFWALGPDATFKGPSPLTGDPLLGPLADNGRVTQTMMPQPGSPAIDQASVLTPPITVDQRLVGIAGPRPDIGAVEGNVFVVTTAADELDPPGSPGAGYSLREAIRDVAKDGVIQFDRAVFHSASTNTITLTQGPLNLQWPCELDGTPNPGGISIVYAPTITVQPQPQSVASGATANFSVMVTNVSGGVNHNTKGHMRSSILLPKPMCILMRL